MLLNKKVIVVTGGAGLLGYELVRAIIKEGGIPIIADLNPTHELKEKVISHKDSKDKNVQFLELDITSKESINNLIQKVHATHGRIDALINSAYPRNVNYGRKFFEVEFEDFVENIGLHLGGYFLSSQLFAKYFNQQGSGNIINMSSVYGSLTPRFEIYSNTTMTNPVEYVAIKSALNQLTRYMAKYFKSMNIRVNSVSPGGILDGQPQEFLKNYNKFCLSKGMLDSNDVSGAVIFLLSEMSQYINGQNIIIDDGFSL